MYNTILVTKLQSKDLQQSLSELSAEGNYKISICNDVEEIIARMGPLQPDLIIASTDIEEVERSKMIKAKEVLSKFTDILFIFDFNMTDIRKEIHEWRSEKLKANGYFNDNPFKES